MANWAGDQSNSCQQTVRQGFDSKTREEHEFLRHSRSVLTRIRIHRRYFGPTFLIPSPNNMSPQGREFPMHQEPPMLQEDLQSFASSSHLTSYDSSSENTLTTQQDQDDNDQSIAKGGVSTPFPWKLHEMLDDMAKKEDSSVVCWQPHGRAFMVHDPKAFVTQIMPGYFNQTKYASFQRQLNLYGFSRLSHGRDKGAYYHQCFVRGQRNLCRNMIRQKIKGTKVRRSLSAEEEPNFYSAEYRDSTKPSPPLPTVPVVGKRECQGSTSSSKPRTKKRKTEAAPESLVSLMREGNFQTTPTPRPVLPPPNVIRSRQSGPTTSQQEHQQAHHPVAQQTKPTSGAMARGGDLLYFEGQPFRYLEHIEELPPPPRPNRNPLHGMVTSLVTMNKPAWPQRRADVGQELYSR
eukprot:scaffold4518_cov149-Cylindrotheca_fusiformis.AAC.19